MDKPVQKSFGKIEKKAVWVQSKFKVADGKCQKLNAARHSLLMVLCSGRDVIVLPIVIKSADGCLAKIQVQIDAH